MPTLISMEMSKEEAKEQMEPKAGDAPKYPWGLEIRLNGESMTKLGIADSLKVGSEVVIVAKATVSSLSSYQQQDGDKESNCDLQITDMTVATDASIADKLYDSK